MTNQKIISLLSIFFFVLYFSPLNVFAMTPENCAAGGGTYESGVCSCPSGETWSGDSCVSNNYNGGGGTVETSTEASQCLSARCAPPDNVMGSTVSATYNYSTGECSCPSGYSSADVNTFNETRGFSSGSSSSGGTNGSSSSGSSTGSSSSTFNYETTTSSGTINNPVSYSSLADLLNAIITWIRNIGLLLAPLLIVYGGFTYITAMGETAKITKAKQILLYAAIGLIVVLLAQSLLGVIQNWIKPS